MFESSCPRIPVEQVRDQLCAWIEHVGYDLDGFQVDEVVADYLQAFGPMPVGRVTAGDLVRITAAHRKERPAAGACPPWCDVDHREVSDSIERATGRDVRDHSRTLSAHVELTLTEYEDEPLFSRPTLLMVCVDPEPLNAARVRQLAAELLDGADTVDKVTGGATWTEDRL